MQTRLIRGLLSLIAFFAILHSSRPAAADVTIAGTVGEMGTFQFGACPINGGGCGNTGWMRFKMLDLNVTKTCLQAPNNPSTSTAGYAYVTGADAYYKEVVAMLLVSKKGAMISCTVLSNTDCRVTSCTLP